MVDVVTNAQIRALVFYFQAASAPRTRVDRHLLLADLHDLHMWLYRHPATLAVSGDPVPLDDRERRALSVERNG
jgi:hypothetical protein